MQSVAEFSNYSSGNNAGNLEAAAFLLINVPISRKGTYKADYINLTAKEMALKQKRDHDFETAAVDRNPGVAECRFIDSTQPYTQEHQRDCR